MSSVTTSPRAIEATAVTEHCVATYHADLRRQLPRFDLLIAKLAAQYGLAHFQLQSIAELFVALEAALGEHMEMQEQLLFPRLKRLCKQRQDFVLHEQRVAELLHELSRLELRIETLFEEISEVTDGYQAPEGACRSYQYVIEALRSLECQTREHFEAEARLIPLAADDSPPQW